MVNDLVENRALCELYPLKKNNCNEMTSAYKQADDMHALQDYIDAQYGGPGKGFFRIVKSSAEARQVINAGKLAVVLGVEVSEVLNCGQTNGTPKCTAAQIDSELNGLYNRGVRSLFPVHKFDNALGGTKFDSGTTGVVVNAGNKYATGQFWAANHCDAADHDNEPTNPAGQKPRCCPRCSARCWPPSCSPGSCRSIRPGRSATRRAHRLGDHLIRAMMAQGHDRRDRSHEHEGPRSRRSDPRGAELPRRDLESLLGRPGQPEADPEARRARGPDLERVHPVRRRSGRWPAPTATRASRSARLRLRHQRPPRAARAAPGRRAEPGPYPFRSFDGGSMIDRQHSGTRVYDINTDGVDHYGLYPDWIEDLRMVAGQQIVNDMANGAEAYLQMWARAEAAAH